MSDKVDLIPIVFDTLRVMEAEMKDPEIDFIQAAAAKDFIPLSKREGFWKRMRGTFGKNLDTAAYR